jgi:hypothetical protein
MKPLRKINFSSGTVYQATDIITYFKKILRNLEIEKLYNVRNILKIKYLYGE